MIALVLVLLLLVGVASALLFVRHLPSPRAIANALARGDTERASSLLDSTNWLPPDPARALVEVCVRLQQGRLTEARDATSRLAALRPDADESRFLRALVEARMSSPAAGWTSALLEALRVSGLKQPIATLLPEAGLDLKSPDPVPTLEDAQDRFLVAYADAARPFASEVIAAARNLATSGGSTSVLFAALDVLATATDAQPDRALVRQLAERLRHVHGPIVSVEVFVALLESDAQQPASTEALDALELAVQQGPLTVPFGELFHAFLRVLARVDSGSAHTGAFSGAVGAYVASLPTVTLKRLATSTAERGSPDAKRRLAAVMGRMGELHEAQRTLLDLGLARMYLEQAAALSGDTALAARGVALKLEFERLYAGTRTARFIGGFPLAPVDRELLEAAATDERTLLGLFAPPFVAVP